MLFSLFAFEKNLCVDDFIVIEYSSVVFSLKVLLGIMLPEENLGLDR